MRGDRSEAVKAAGAGVMASLLEAAGRAAARQKHLQQNLTRTSANLTGALEEVERVRVSALEYVNCAFCVIVYECASAMIAFVLLAAGMPI
jgi:hypothetical protein